MTPLRLFGLPLRRRPAPRAVDPAAAAAVLRDLAQLPDDTLLASLQTTAEGLTNHEVALRYREDGPNAVADEHPPSGLRHLVQIVVSPLSLLLIALAGVNALTGSRESAAVIVAIVILASLLSFLQEYRSAKAAETLRALVHVKATLLRRLHPHNAVAGQGQAVQLPLLHIVRGDIVRLAAGNLVPADVRILAAKDLFVNQSTLTGESVPVEKFGGAASIACAPFELPNVAFMGTYVTSGTATAVVLATGPRTQFGHIAHDLVAARGSTSFEIGIRRYLWLIVSFMLVMVPAVFLVNGVLKGDWLEALLFAIAIGVGMTPEMLPVVITVNLAKGALAMAGKRVIVKRLASIQNFGAMDVLATDKTGTLTQNRVILERHVDIAGMPSPRVLEFACLNSVFQSGTKSLLDEAVLTHAELEEHIRAGVGYVKIDEVPFDFERRRMSVVVESTDHSIRYLICKGAVEEISAACTRAERRGAVVPLEPDHADDLHAVTRGLNGEGFRVIAVAYKEMPADPVACSIADETEMVLLGYIAFLDPPKETAGPAIESLRSCGVAVKVLTGDNELVTRHVCRQVGLPSQTALLGSEIAAMSDPELSRRAEATTIFAKLSPEEKARVIRALRARGHVVGYLGDGINDVPALAAADVGISVDSAVDVAKGAAAIILLENSLLVLHDGVVEGRRVFGNVIKYVRMAGSSSFGNMLSMLGASALLPFLPMTPVQILFNNLLYDISQMALATDNVDAEYLAMPRRWDVSGIGRYMVAIGPLSSIFDYVTFGVLAFAFGALAHPALFQTGWFVESLLSQTLIVHVIRTGKVPFVESRPSRALLATTIAVCAFGAWLPFSPFASWLGLERLPPHYWPALAAIIVGYLVLTQLVKTRAIRRLRLE